MDAISRDSQERIRPSVLRSYDELDAVRSILLGPEQQKIEQIEHALERPTSVSEVAAVLPKSVQLCVKREPRALSEALFPIIGPAIRRAIASALRDMVETLNLLAERSLSLRSWIWRLEAWRTGRPFAEVALAHSLVFQVEKVFLIHHKTGTLLAEVGAQSIADADTVSAMLTAITDFVSDSFAKQEVGVLNELRVGSHTIIIEEQNSLLLACVIQGIAPLARIRDVQKEVLSDIVFEYATELDRYRGDVSPFVSSQAYLERCLLRQFVGPAPGHSSLGSRIALVLLIGILGVAALRTGLQLVQSARIAQLTERLRKEPGLVIVREESQAGVHVISGLRDPLAIDPIPLIVQHKLSTQDVRFVWAAYQSIDPYFVEARVRKLLQPPSSLSLKLVSGALECSGSAGHRWIEDAKRLAPSVAGVERVRFDRVIDVDVQSLQQSQAALSSVLIHFERGQFLVPPSEQANLAAVRTKVRALFDAARALQIETQVTMVGHADPLGTDLENLALSKQRAEEIRRLLVQSGLPEGRLVAEGAGVVSASQVPNERDQRSVSFSVRRLAP